MDRYALLQVFTKFGKVSKLDFLFHKAGPNKGKPRGYAFLEYLHEGVSHFVKPCHLLLTRYSIAIVFICCGVVIIVIRSVTDN